MVTVSPLTKGEINKSCNHSKDNIKCLNLYALNRISDKFMTLKCKKKKKNQIIAEVRVSHGLDVIAGDAGGGKSGSSSVCERERKREK